MKLVIWITSFLVTIFPAVSSDISSILMYPSGKIKIYSTYQPNAMNPFSRTGYYYLLPGTLLELIEEYPSANPLTSDIYHVQIRDGNQKGADGYVYESDVQLIPKTAINAAAVILKEITPEHNPLYQIREYNPVTQTYFLESIKPIESGKLFRIEVQSLNDLIFLNKRTLIYRHLIRSGYQIIKIADPDTLQPVEGVNCSSERSDINGLIFIKKNTAFLTFTKDSYTPGYLQTRVVQPVYLLFMSRINRYAPPFLPLKSDDGTISIHTNESEIKYRFFNRRLDLFCSPAFDYSPYRILASFYMATSGTPVQGKLDSNAETVYLFRYQPDKQKWNELRLFNRDKVLEFNIDLSGYYLILENNPFETKTIQAEIPAGTSQIYISSMARGILSTMNPDGKFINIPQKKYESLYFSIDSPEKVQQKIHYPDDRMKIEINSSSERSDLPFTYYDGYWKHLYYKKEGQPQLHTDFFEELSDLYFYPPDQFVIRKDGIEYRGIFQILNESRMIFKIISFNCLIKTPLNSDFYQISPSLFDSSLLIPCNYQFKQSTLKLSFDKVLFERKNHFTGSSQLPVYFLHSASSGTISFPDPGRTPVYENLFQFEIKPE